MVNFSRAIVNQKQSKFQFGFTEDWSPVFAALILTEIIADANDNNEELYIAPA